MRCSSPPPLTEEHLDSALAGEADSGVLEHLSHCADCAARLAEARKVDQMLTALLFRWNCPTAQQLADYHLQVVEEEQSMAIRRHLDQCSHCQAELAQLRLFMADERTARPVTPPVRAALPRLGDLFAQLIPQAALPALRGTNSG